MQTYDIRVRPMEASESDMFEATAVFVDGYYHELSILSIDRAQLIDTFKRMICPDVFYVAELDDEIVGILACSNNRKRAIAATPSILRKSFGFWKGSLAYLFMKNEFNKPLPYPSDTGYIECVATSVKARRKGVSTALFRYVMNQAPYRRYILEVVDTNVNACRLYEKLGFKELERKKKGWRRRKVLMSESIWI